MKKRKSHPREKGALDAIIKENPDLSIDEIAAFTGYSRGWVAEIVGELRSIEARENSTKSVKTLDVDEPLYEVLLLIMEGMTEKEQKAWIGKHIKKAKSKHRYTNY